MIATGDSEIFEKTVKYKENLKEKIVKANKELSSKEFKYRVTINNLYLYLSLKIKPN